MHLLFAKNNCVCMSLDIYCTHIGDQVELLKPSVRNSRGIGRLVGMNGKHFARSRKELIFGLLVSSLIFLFFLIFNNEQASSLFPSSDIRMCCPWALCVSQNADAGWGILTPWANSQTSVWVPASLRRSGRASKRQWKGHRRFQSSFSWVPGFSHNLVWVA